MPQNYLDHIRWKATAAHLLALVGALVFCVKAPDIQQAIQGWRFGGSTSSSTEMPGMSAQTLAAIADQLRTALRVGGQETFTAGRLVCQIGDTTLTIINPIDMVADDGSPAAAAVAPGTSGADLDVVVFDRQHPGAPNIAGTQACTLSPDASDVGLQMGQDYTFYFADGDSDRPINQLTGKPYVLVQSGQPLKIGELVVADGQ